MNEEHDKWFFEKLVYSPRLQLPKYLAEEYYRLYDELIYLDRLRPPINELPKVEKQKTELENKIQSIENKVIDYFKDELPRTLAYKYLGYFHSCKESARKQE